MKTPNRVAYVEDESIFHVLGQAFVKRSNFCKEFHCYLTADEFLKSGEQYDMVFVDFYLRVGMSSLELMEKLAEDPVPVVMLTASIRKHGIKQIMEKYSFVFGYIDKTKFNDDTLNEFRAHLESDNESNFYKE